MPWTELPHLRNQRSKTYQDDTNPLKKTWSGTLAALHYESEIDSDIYDAEVDVTPIRVDNSVFDGWRAIANGWHYALGKDLEHQGDQDGWVGFGGRQGTHWFKFRLLRLGYLHWPTRAWDDIGGAPTYDRADLSHETGTLTIGPNDNPINVSSLATWQNLWFTPTGGQLDTRWRVDGYGLKEEIVVNQAGREWIAANRPPTTPLSETYFGFVFRIDWSEIPRVYRAGLLQDIDSDFADDGEQIRFHDALHHLLAFMPISELTVPNEDPHLEERQPLRKRFWKDPNGNHYLLIGIRCDILNEMSAGDLIFDPTINAQVGADPDDGRWQKEPGENSYFNSGDAHPAFMSTAVGYDWVNLYARFDGIQFASAPTIVTATFTWRAWGAQLNNPGDALVSAVDQDDPAAPTGFNDADARARTTANVTWDIGAWPVNGNWYGPGNLDTEIQEIADSYDYVNFAKAIVLYVETIGAALDLRVVYAREQDAPSAPKLDIVYTEAAAVGGHMTLWGRYWGP